MTKTPPLVSVIITTKNEEENIGNCLLSVYRQDYSNIEIIVIDNFSTDKTVEIAKGYNSIIRSIGPERSAQRNEGIIRVAKGKYALYLDADMLITSTLVSECVNALTDTDSVALYIPEIVVGGSQFAKIRRFERQYYSGTVIDAVRFFERETFRRVGGFDEVVFRDGSGEDWDLDKKIRSSGNTRTLISHSHLTRDEFIANFLTLHQTSVPSSFVGILHNESKDKLWEYLLKKRYYSKGFSGYVAKWGKGDPDVKVQLGPISRFITIFFVYGNWKKTLKNPVGFVAVISLKILIGLFTFDRIFLTFLKPSKIESEL